MIIESTAILKNAVDSSPFEVGTGYLPRIEKNDEAALSSVVVLCGLQIQETKQMKMQLGNSSSTSQLLTYRLNGPWVQDTLRLNEKAYETDDMKAYLKENPNFETAINQLKDSPVKRKYSRCSLRCTDRSPSYIQRDHASGI